MLPPAGAYCLSATPEPRGVAGEAYRTQRAREALALQALTARFPLERLGPADLAAWAAALARDPVAGLTALTDLPPEPTPEQLRAPPDPLPASCPAVVEWRSADRSRELMVPAGQWLLVRLAVPFRATLTVEGESVPRHAESTPLEEGHAALFAPRWAAARGRLDLEGYGAAPSQEQGTVRFLAAAPEVPRPALGQGRVLLTNGRGGMARLAVDWGAIESKYDCLLGANLHPELPVDRHIFAKRARVWVNADSFLSPLNADQLLAFDPGPPPRWRFLAHAGDGRGVEIELTAAMMAGRNTTVLRFHRPAAPPPQGRPLPPEADVRLTVRVDLEDRNFHHETKHHPGLDAHFRAHTVPLADRPGFVFTPAPDRCLRVGASTGVYHPQPEWVFNIPHPIEQSRGLEGHGDTYSPGWFELPLAAGDAVTVLVSADPDDPSAAELERALVRSEPRSASDAFAGQLRQALDAFVVRRGAGLTVIAGYPWFLDWGRDTFITCRGLLAAGRLEAVQTILLLQSSWERDGTLPNAVFGADLSNRDTADAPLWFGLACEETWDRLPDSAARRAWLATPVDQSGRSLAQVLRSIAAGYLRGTPNGLRVDAASALVFCPAHFTWMDTNHPACTPRAGYPIEIQALWIRLLRFLARLDLPPVAGPWEVLAATAAEHLERLFWLEGPGWYADVLLAEFGQPATTATPQDALRPNALWPVALGVVRGARAQRQVEAARRWLLVPGGLRTLAPLPVQPPLEIRGRHGELLGDPVHPYRGRYEGDEDTQRKPAYHNGTAWPWLLPVFCEALARAWDFAPQAVAAARAYLGSSAALLAEGCLGQLPELLDGDVPHSPRGCDAQAWSVSETLRVWELLQAVPPPPG